MIIISATCALRKSIFSHLPNQHKITYRVTWRPTRGQTKRKMLSDSEVNDICISVSFCQLRKEKKTISILFIESSFYGGSLVSLYVSHIFKDWQNFLVMILIFVIKSTDASNRTSADSRKSFSDKFSINYVGDKIIT